MKFCDLASSWTSAQPRSGRRDRRIIVAVRCLLATQHKSRNRAGNDHVQEDGSISRARRQSRVAPSVEGWM